MQSVSCFSLLNYTLTIDDVYHVISLWQPIKQEGSSSSNQCVVIGPYIEQRRADIILDYEHKTESRLLLSCDADSLNSSDDSPQISRRSNSYDYVKIFSSYDEINHPHKEPRQIHYRSKSIHGIFPICDEIFIPTCDDFVPICDDILPKLTRRNSYIKVESMQIAATYFALCMSIL